MTCSICGGPNGKEDQRPHLSEAHVMTAYGTWPEGLSLRRFRAQERRLRRTEGVVNGPEIPHRQEIPHPG